MIRTLNSTSAPLANMHGQPSETLQHNRTLVRTWLYVIVAFLITIFIVGGATRLMEAGLSITEWKPIHGVIPPLGEADWLEEFAKYQQIPEYAQLKQGMSLDEFKVIFWWEWAHRILARLVGVVMALPLIWFWASGRLESGLKPKLLAILALGGLQGAVGWWMVSSGLSVRTDVSQYRLASHLTLACFIFILTLSLSRRLAVYSAPAAPRSTQRVAGWLVVLILVQIYLGALVAGLDAGMAYNSWPLMDGSLIPSDLFSMHPTWLNLFENTKTVQYVHRLGAYLIFVLAAIHAYRTWKLAPGSTHANRALLLLLAVTTQAAIGITTLLLVVPFSWALVHHACGILLLGFATMHWSATKGSLPFPAERSA